VNRSRFAPLVLAALCPGCSKETPPPEPSEAAPTQPAHDPSRVYRIGETAALADYAFSVSEVKLCTATRAAPEPGHVRLGTHVTVEGRSEREVPANPFHARLVERGGEARSWGARFGGCEPALMSVRVAKGESLSGWISFEVPDNAGGLELHYSPWVLGAGELVVKFQIDGLPRAGE
jgi:hypothetical protein